MPVVLDASVTLAFCLQDEQSDYADAVLEQLRRDRAVVPAIWAIEVGNGLLVAERRGRVSASDLAEVHSLLVDLPITPREVTLNEVLGPLIHLARAHALTLYDAAYLHLATREGLPLATQDTDLLRAAGRVGVQLV